MSRAFPRVLTAELCRGPPKDSPSVAHVSPLSRVKLKILTTRLTACG